MSQPEPSPEFLAFIRAMFGVDAVFEVESFNVRDLPLCDNPDCLGCVDERKRRTAEYNRRVARSTRN